MGFIANFVAFQQCKNYKNRFRFDKVTESLKVGSFLRDSVDGTQQAAICVSEPGDILTRFSDQKVGGQGHSRQRLPVEFNLVIFHFLIIKFIFSSLFMHRFGSDSTFMAREIFTVFLLMPGVIFVLSF